MIVSSDIKEPAVAFLHRADSSTLQPAPEYPPSPREEQVSLRQGQAETITEGFHVTVVVLVELVAGMNGDRMVRRNALHGTAGADAGAGQVLGLVHHTVDVVPGLVERAGLQDPGRPSDRRIPGSIR